MGASTCFSFLGRFSSATGSSPTNSRSRIASCALSPPTTTGSEIRSHLRSSARFLNLATSCGREVSPAEAQLDMLGVARNTEITTAFGLAPLLLQGTRRIALVHERLAWLLSDQTSLRLLEPPMPLQPINQLMLWTTRAENDPGLQWLRNRILTFAEEHDASKDEPVLA